MFGFSNYQEQSFGQENVFGFSQDQEQEQAFALCSDLLSVATQLGITTGFEGMLTSEMATEQLKSIEFAIAEAIEAEYEAKKEDLRRLKRCPQGYSWDREGDGWRCQGGSHYCTAEEIKRYME